MIRPACVSCSAHRTRGFLSSCSWSSSSPPLFRWLHRVSTWNASCLRRIGWALAGSHDIIIDVRPLNFWVSLLRIINSACRDRSKGQRSYICKLQEDDEFVTTLQQLAWTAKQLVWPPVTIDENFVQGFAVWVLDIYIPVLSRCLALYKAVREIVTLKSSSRSFWHSLQNITHVYAVN